MGARRTDCTAFEVTGAGTITLDLEAKVEGQRQSSTRTLQAVPASWTWTWLEKGPVLAREPIRLSGAATAGDGTPVYATLPGWRTKPDLVESVDWKGTKATVTMRATELPAGLPPLDIRDTADAVELVVAGAAPAQRLEATVKVAGRTLHDMGRLELVVQTPDRCVLTHEVETPPGPTVGTRGTVPVRARENAPPGPCEVSGTLTLFGTAFPVAGAIELGT